MVLLLCAVTLLVLDAPAALRLAGAGLLAVHAGWVLPRHILLGHPGAVCRLRHDGQGWWLWSRAQGWQPVQLLRDSLAWPVLVIVRYRLPGCLWPRSVCIFPDALPADQHRKLRVRLRFSRRRWAAPE